MDIPNSGQSWLLAMSKFFNKGPLAAKTIKSDLGPFLFDVQDGFRVDPKREVEVANKIKTALCNEPIEYSVTISNFDQPDLYATLLCSGKNFSDHSLECLRVKSNKDLNVRAICMDIDEKTKVASLKIIITPKTHLYNDYSLSLAYNIPFLPQETNPLRHTTKIGKTCETLCDFGSEFISSGSLSTNVESSLRSGKNVILDLGSYHIQFPGELELLSSGVLGLGSFPIDTLTIDKLRTISLFEQLFPNGIHNADDENSENKQQTSVFLDSLRKTADFKTVISINDKNKNPHLHVSFIVKDRPKLIEKNPPENIETNITFTDADELFSLLNFEIKVGLLEESCDEAYMTIEANDSMDLTITHETLDEDLISTVLSPIINRALDENRKVTLKRKNIVEETDIDYISIRKDDKNTVLYISDLSDRDFLPLACDLLPNILERNEEVIIPFNSCDEDYESGRLAIKEFLANKDIDTRVWFKGKKEIRVKRI